MDERIRDIEVAATRLRAEDWPPDHAGVPAAYRSGQGRYELLLNEDDGLWDELADDLMEYATGPFANRWVAREMTLNYFTESLLFQLLSVLTIAPNHEFPARIVIIMQIHLMKKFDLPQLRRRWAVMCGATDGDEADVG